jgi:type IV secretion system protein VirD4
MTSLQRKMLVATGLLLGGAIVLSMAATQYVAWRFAWHPALGVPWLGQIHAPWRWLDWQARFGATAPEIFETLHAGLGLAGMLISASLLALASTSHRKPKRHDGIHGTAHWAAPGEVEAAGLLSETGVHVGGWRDERGRLRILRHDGRSMSRRSRRPGPARASASLCRHCSPGRTASSSTTRRANCGT